MKSAVKITTFLFLTFCLHKISFGQWDLNGNIIGGTNFIGTLNNEPLRLRTDLAQPIIFQTNGANERMRLTQTGELGLGTTAPVSLLHLNSASATAIHGRFTNTNTGATVNDGFRVGISATGEAELRQAENLSHLFLPTMQRGSACHNKPIIIILT